MEKCKECKVYSPMCKESGICAFITVGYVMAEDDSCRSGEIVKDVYELGVKKGRAEAVNNFVANAITEFQKFDKEHGYPTLEDISVILSDVAEQLKEHNDTAGA